MKAEKAIVKRAEFGGMENIEKMAKTLARSDVGDPTLRATQ